MTKENIYNILLIYIKKESDYMALDPIQQQASRHVNGSAMILAGPGSGKTTVITHRIYNLIKEHHVDSSKILVITFTKMAAKQMKERFLKLCNKSQSEVVFGTFHAIFFMILKTVFHYQAQDIIKEQEQWRFIKNQLAFHAVSVQDEASLTADILSEISKVKSERIDIQTYISFSCNENLFRCLYNEYQQMLWEEHKIDFEDMMITTLEVLKNRKDILNYWQNKYDYILIDEFQDAAPVQLQIVNLLCAVHKNIFIVGDDDQSIYGFRGAAPNVMKAFIKIYPETFIYKLNINYRSNRYIVEMATHLINHNKDRFYKDLQAFHSYSEKVNIQAFQNITEQNHYIMDLIYQWKDIAILTRTNSCSASVIKMLEHYGINVTSSQAGKSDLSRHWITLDIAAYLQIAGGSRKRSDYLRIINKPCRYISRDYFTDTIVCLKKIEIDMKQKGQKENWKEWCQFQEQMKWMQNMTTYAKVNYIRKGIHYDSYIKNYCKEQGIDSKPFMDILDQIQECAKEVYFYDEWIQRLSNYKSKEEETLCNKSYHVQVCTMHSCKGLEFDNVLLIDVNEGMIPYSKADTKEGIEEERRLFYVAVTRAKQRLFISYLKKRYDATLQPSRFIKELYNSP